MQKYNVIGVKESRFKPQDSDNEIRGYTIFCTYEDQHTDGLAADRQFIKEAVINECGIPKVGMQISLNYNRWGKIDGYQVLSAPKA